MMYQIQCTTGYEPYARHLDQKPLLNTNHNLLEKKEMILKNGVKNIQAAGFIGACTVHELRMYDTTEWLVLKEKQNKSETLCQMAVHKCKVLVCRSAFMINGQSNRAACTNLLLQQQVQSLPVSVLHFWHSYAAPSAT